MSNIINTYASKLHTLHVEPIENLSKRDLNLIDLSHSLYELSLLSKKHQHIDYDENLISLIAPSEKNILFSEVVKLHKMLSHFILKHKDSNAST
jgi:hypothetical protein